MKILKSSLALALMALATIFTACSDEGYWEAANVEQGYSFSSATYNNNYGGGDKVSEIKVTVMRSSSVGNDTLALTAAGFDDIFTVPASVTFENGKNTAEVAIAVNGDLVVGTTYSGTIEFDSKLVSPSGNSKCTVNAKKEYNWVNYGTASVWSSWVGNWGDAGLGAPINVPVQYAEGTDGLYRFVSMYWYMEPDYAAKGYDIQFELDKSMQPVGLPRLQPIGEQDDDGGEYCLYFLTSGNYAGAFVYDEGYYIIQTVMGTDAGSLVAYENIAFTFNK